MPGRRARLHRRVPARRRLHAADGRVPAAGEAASRRTRGGDRHRAAGDVRARSSPRPCSTATRRGSTTRRGRPRRRPRSRRRSAGTHNYSGAELAARRPRAAAHQRPPARVLEGREPRRLRRRRAGCARRSTTASPSSRRTTAPSAAGRRRSRSPSATCARTSSSPPATRSTSTIPRLTDGPDARRPGHPAAHAAPRRRLHRAGLHAAARRENQRRRSSVDYDATLDPVHDALRRHRGLTGSPRSSLTFPFFGSEDGQIDAPRRRAGASSRRPRWSCSARGSAAPTRSSQQLHAGRAHARGLRPERPRLPRQHRRVHLLRDAAARLAHRSTASCSTPSRATASSTRARWRCCCGWRASPRACRPASRPARRTPRPASTSCATSTRTPGSRPTTRAIGWVTFDPTPAASPARSPAADAVSHAAARAPARPARSPPATRSPSAAPASRSPPSAPVVALRRCSRSALLAAAALGFLGVRRWRRGAPPALSASSSARCAARAAERHPGHDAARARAALRRHARRGRGYVRALRESRYRDAPARPDPRPAPRAAFRARTRRRPARPPARLVGAAAALKGPGPFM